MNEANNLLPIIVAKNTVRFSARYLGATEALVWVGGAHAPVDNDDAIVRVERDLVKKRYPYVPSGMAVGNPQNEDRPIMLCRMQPLLQKDGYYTLDVSRWPAGVYRLNYHALPGAEAPAGQAPQPGMRDRDLIWPVFWEAWDAATRETIRPFIHRERNRPGTYSFRILIRLDRNIEPFGTWED